MGSSCSLRSNADLSDSVPILSGSQHDMVMRGICMVFGVNTCLDSSQVIPLSYSISNVCDWSLSCSYCSFQAALHVENTASHWWAQHLAKACSLHKCSSSHRGYNNSADFMMQWKMCALFWLVVWMVGCDHRWPPQHGLPDVVPLSFNPPACKCVNKLLVDLNATSSVESILVPWAKHHLSDVMHHTCGALVSCTTKVNTYTRMKISINVYSIYISIGIYY